MTQTPLHAAAHTRDTARRPPSDLKAASLVKVIVLRPDYGVLRAPARLCSARRCSRPFILPRVQVLKTTVDKARSQRQCSYGYARRVPISRFVLSTTIMYHEVGRFDTLCCFGAFGCLLASLADQVGFLSLEFRRGVGAHT